MAAIQCQKVFECRILQVRQFKSVYWGYFKRKSFSLAGIFRSLLGLVGSFASVLVASFLVVSVLVVLVVFCWLPSAFC